jgi:hypothetical protein
MTDRRDITLERQYVGWVREARMFDLARDRQSARNSTSQFTRRSVGLRAARSIEPIPAQRGRASPTYNLAAEVIE